jgi:S1-C subfamily serine protease
MCKKKSVGDQVSSSAVSFALLTLFTFFVSPVLADPLLRPFELHAPIEFSSPLPSSGAAMAGPMEQVMQSVVRVDALVPEGARTAATHGRERTGTGVVLDANGLVLTVGYIVAEASSVLVTFSDGEKVPSQIVAYDHASGIALLRANRRVATKPVKLAKAQSGKKDEHALIVPSEGEASIKAVKIGKIKKFTSGWEYVMDDAIYTYPPSTDFAGSALLSQRGELLGIGALVTIDIDIDPKVRVPGNVFIPINSVQNILGDLLTQGRSEESQRPWLGLHLKETKQGIKVNAVEEDGPAEASGIKTGDTIVAVEQMKVKSLNHFYKRIWEDFEPGEKIHLLVLRDDQYANVPVESVDLYKWLKLDTGTPAITELVD